LMRESVVGGGREDKRTGGGGKGQGEGGKTEVRCQMLDVSEGCALARECFYRLLFEW